MLSGENQRIGNVEVPTAEVSGGRVLNLKGAVLELAARYPSAFGIVTPSAPHTAVATGTIVTVTGTAENSAEVEVTVAMTVSATGGSGGGSVYLHCDCNRYRRQPGRRIYSAG